jgi:aspartate kinase
MIVQNVAENGNTAVSFTVPRNEVRDAIDAIQPSVEKMGGRIGLVDENVSKVSVVGLGMAEQTGVANRMFQTLANAAVNMEIITTSEIKISALVKREQALNALRTVHSEFALDKVESKEPTQLPSRDTSNQVNVAEVIERLQRDTGMESLMIDDISLDDSQSRITLSKVPNAPGIAAQLFDRIAAAGVFVDMIVQSYASSQIADITFTMPREQFDNAITVANQVCEDFGCDKVDFKKTIAKLSVSGVGLRSHTGVAIGMFRALSDANINIETMNTSEVRVNVIVDGDSGQTGIQCLRDAFRHSLR